MGSLWLRRPWLVHQARDNEKKIFNRLETQAYHFCYSHSCVSDIRRPLGVWRVRVHFASLPCLGKPQAWLFELGWWACSVTGRLEKRLEGILGTSWVLGRSWECIRDPKKPPRGQKKNFLAHVPPKSFLGHSFGGENKKTFTAHVPNESFCCALSWAVLGSAWRASWGRLGVLGGSWERIHEPKETSKAPEKKKTFTAHVPRESFFGHYFGALRALLGPSWALWGSSWTQPIGVLLGR
jgi:hypothetical protein